MRVNQIGAHLVGMPSKSQIGSSGRSENRFGSFGKAVVDGGVNWFFKQVITTLVELDVRFWRPMAKNLRKIFLIGAINA